jgi:hypothetical protein
VRNDLERSWRKNLERKMNCEMKRNEGVFHYYISNWMFCLYTDFLALYKKHYDWEFSVKGYNCLLRHNQIKVYNCLLILNFNKLILL